MSNILLLLLYLPLQKCRFQQVFDLNLAIITFRSTWRTADVVE